ncbi:MAG: PfkB family carbohydrate kinase [Acidimicrobiia bacterium]
MSPARRGRRPRVCVVGDLLADADIAGSADRLSPEAPVPVVDQRQVVHRAGGAGLAATMAVRGGATVTLVAAIADDEPGRRLPQLLADEFVDVCPLPWEGTTIEKVRIAAAGVPMLRLDRGEGRVAGSLAPAVAQRVTAAITGADAVLVADYGRGVAAHPVVRDAIAAARRAGTPVVWDPHRKGPDPVPGSSVVCPNRAEAAAYEPDVAGATLTAEVERARRLRARWDVGAVAVTLGSEGAVVVLGDGAPLTVPVLEPVEGTDTCGAGDAFAAATTVALAGGAVVSEAIHAAVLGAGEFVAAGGASGMQPARRRPRTPTASARRAERDRRPTTLVATGGCFDILHPGHVHTLRAARCLGDRLVVLVNDDESVRRLKGPERPLQPVEDRVAVLRSLADVDDVIVFSEDTPVEALRQLQPDVFVKGGDYTAAEIPETAVLAEWGGSVVTVPFLDGRSTTDLVTRARAGRPA